MKRIGALCAWLCLCLYILFACAVPEERDSIPVAHPDEVGRNELCTECHETEEDSIIFERYDHTVYFSNKHGHEASRSARVCNMCHQQSFCNDCHVTRTGLKPSIKNQTGTYRRMPHRGDYLTRHRIDGRIDPIPCFRCHGNPKSSQTCVRCHG